MLPKLSLSLTAAIALTAAAGRTAHAAAMETPNGNARIDAAETGNPQSLDYSHRPALPPDDNTNAEWQSSESANPDSI